MNRLSKEKRNQLILAIAGTVLLLSVIYFGLIGPENSSLLRVADLKSRADAQLRNIKKVIAQSDDTASQLTDASYSLLHAEGPDGDIASGDLYAWVYDKITMFKKTYKVEIPSIPNTVAMGDVDVLPHFPYKQLRVSVSGTAYYHDFGKFIADLENTFPHIRVVSLTLDPAGADSEKLNFRMDIVALVKPNP
jgi:hypothetical protein